MEFSWNNSVSFTTSSSILSWCINDTTDPEAIFESEELQNYGDLNVTLSDLCNIGTSDLDSDQTSLSSSKCYPSFMYMRGESTSSLIVSCSSRNCLSHFVRVNDYGDHCWKYISMPFSGTCAKT